MINRGITFSVLIFIYIYKEYNTFSIHCCLYLFLGGVVALNNEVTPSIYNLILCDHALKTRRKLYMGESKKTKHILICFSTSHSSVFIMVRVNIGIRQPNYNKFTSLYHFKDTKWVKNKRGWIPLCLDSDSITLRDSRWSYLENNKKQPKNQDISRKQLSLMQLRQLTRFCLL